MGQAAVSSKSILPDNTELINSSLADSSSSSHDRSILKLSKRQKYVAYLKEPKVSSYVAEVCRVLAPYKAMNKNNFRGATKPPVIVMSTGIIYRGEWLNGEPHGLGELFFPDGSYFQGSFCLGFASGDGRFIHSGGSYFQGEIKQNLAEGSGRLVNDVQKYLYEGQWRGDLPNGHGEELWDDSTRYVGNFMNGLKHGQGVYQYANGDRFEGTFQLDSFSGIGLLTTAEWTYKGAFKQGKMEGKGVFKWLDGSVYEGEYAGNRKNGHGYYVDPAGNFIEGAWKDGKQEQDAQLNTGTSSRGFRNSRTRLRS